MVRNAEIWVVLSSNEADLLMLRNRVFRLRIVQKMGSALQTVFDLLMIRNRLFRVRTFYMWSVTP